MKFYQASLIVTGLLMLACGGSHQSRESKISILIGGDSSSARGLSGARVSAVGGLSPSKLTEFGCLVVNVMGEGIANFENPQQDVRPSLDRYISRGSYCSYRGINSALFSLSGAEKKIDLTVPLGDRRVIQILGIVQGTSFRPCDQGRLPGPSEDDDSEYYVIDDAVLSIRGDVTIPLVNRYDTLSETQKSTRIVSCDQSAPTLPTASMVLHFRAQDATGAGTITGLPFRIADSSGNLQISTFTIDNNPNPPTRGGIINGVPTVNFNSGTASYNIVNNTTFGVLNQFSYFLVVRRPGTVSTLERNPAMSWVSTDQNPSGVYDNAGAGSWNMVYEQNAICGSGKILPVSSYNSGYNNGSEEKLVPRVVSSELCLDPQQATVQVLSVVQSLATGLFQGYINGATNGNLSVDAEISGFNFSNSILRIGGRFTNSGFQYLKGDVAEIIVYNSTLSDETRVEVERHLCRKYGVSCSLP